MLALRLGALGLVVIAAFASCKSSSATGAAGGGGAGGSSSSGVGLFGTGGSNAGGADAGPPLSCNELYTTIPAGSCDVLSQNCPEGQTCRANDESSPTSFECVKTTGLKGLGEDCKVHEECQAGLICVNQCTSACCRTTNEPCGGGECNLQLNYNNGEYIFVCAYNKSCKILAADACADGTGCHVDDPVQGLATCTNPSPDQVGDLGACSFLNDCPSMEDCHDAQDGQGRHCRFYCYVDMLRGTGTPGLGGCPSGQSCQSTEGGNPIDLGFPGVGLCFAN